MYSSLNGDDAGTGNVFDYNYWSDYALPLGSLPVWLGLPVNQLLECGDSLNYDLNATAAYPGIDKWWLNDTIRFSIDQIGIITANTILPPGTYGLQVILNDTQGNILTGDFSVTLVDTTTPRWSEQPVDKTLELGESLQYKLNATDLFLDTWWVNDTFSFAIDGEGLITTVGTLPVGTYGVQVWVNDTSNNINSTMFTVTVVDTLPPEWIETPQDQQIEYGTTFVTDLNATDPSGLDQWWVDDTLRFTVDWTGRVRTAGILEPGTYGLTIYVNDIYGHTLSASILVEVKPATVTTVTTTTTTTTTITTTPTTTTTSPVPPVGIDPLVTLILGVGIGGTAVVLIVIVMLRRRTSGRSDAS
jgi:hypothetical protein